MSQDVPFTLIDAGRPVDSLARIVGDVVRLSPAVLPWKLEGDVLCNQGLCVPIPDGVALADADGIDLGALAALLDRPLALDVAERAAYLGVAAAERGRALASVAAPDFTLPDLDGRLHTLADQRGRKVLLVAWASW
jgi:hypothetical protein